MTETALIVEATRYTGPDAIAALQARGYRILCQDATFGDEAARRAFAEQHPHVDMLNAAEPEEAVAEAIAVGPVDVLVDNHLRHPEGRSIEDTTAEDFRAMLEALLVSPYRFVRALVPHMRAQGGGRIVLVTSAAPARPTPKVGLYTAARGAAGLLVRTLAKELGPDGVSVTGIAPNFYASADTYSQERYETEERFRRFVERAVPLGRSSHSEEMQALIGYLASQEAAFVSGQVIAFSGGWA